MSTGRGAKQKGQDLISMFLKSVLDQDRSAIEICKLQHELFI